MMSLSDEIQLPRLDSLADIPYAQETPASWDPDYRKIWQELQVASRNKTQLGGHVRELRSRLSQAIAQRDEGLAREAELRLKVESKDRLIEQGFKTLDRVHCMWAKRLLDATGIPSQVLIPDEEFVKYFEELKGLKQRLADAEKHLSLMVEESDALRGELNDAWAYAGSTGAGTPASSEWAAAKAFLASPDCADGEKAE